MIYYSYDIILYALVLMWGNATPGVLVALEPVPCVVTSCTGSGRQASSFPPVFAALRHMCEFNNNNWSKCVSRSVISARPRFIRVTEWCLCGTTVR